MRLPEISTDTLEKIGTVFLAAAALILAPLMIGGAVWLIWSIWTEVGLLAGLVFLGIALGFIGLMPFIANLPGPYVPPPPPPPPTQDSDDWHTWRKG